MTMAAVRVLVVDDEKPARERLRRLLERDPRVEVVGCCVAGAEALRTMREAARARRAGAAAVPRCPDAGAGWLRRRSRRWPS